MFHFVLAGSFIFQMRTVDGEDVSLGVHENRKQLFNFLVISFFIVSEETRQKLFVLIIKSVTENNFKLAENLKKMLTYFKSVGKLNENYHLCFKDDTSQGDLLYDEIKKWHELSNFSAVKNNCAK